MTQELGTPLLSRNQPGNLSREPCSGLWRSEDMVLLQLHMQREAAHDTVYKLGQLGCVQFRDMNEGASAFQRLFTTDVRRCEDSERRLRYFEEQLKRAKGLKTVMLPDGGHHSTESLDQLEPKLEGYESELRELNSKWEQLLTQKNNMQEHLEILGKEPEFFSGDDSVGVRRPGSVEEDLGMRSGGLRYMTGVISSAQLLLFERLVYRVTRGNMFMRTAPAQSQFEDPATGNKIDKTVFVIFVSAQRAHDKIKKVCESLQATLYPYNIDNREEVQKMHINVRNNLSDLENTIAGTESVRDKILIKIKENVYQWKKTVVIEKSVFNILNFLSFKGQTVVAVAECWVPKNDVGRVEEALHEAERSSGAQVQSFLEAIETRDKPPTYFKTNKFTASHQGIVDSYGIARYKEVNPACFSVITFPFLFGVMYGDIGHGLMITLLALMFIWKEKQLLASPLNEIIALVFGGRYILVIMGIYAVYMGFLYNDLFSLMISFGEPYWIYPKDYDDARANCDNGYVVWYGTNASNIRACKKINGSTYLFGIDSAWAETENKLEFMNGLKMKMAVILGVIQMSLGLVLQCFNHVHFKDTKHIICGFIPEVVFLLCTFGYMCVMIIIKWCINWPARMLNNLSPPSLLETMTNFFLTPGSVKDDKYLFASASTQNSIQTILLLVAFAMVPILLIPIPVIEYRHHKHSSYGQLKHEEPNEEDPGHKGEKAHGEEEVFDMSEVVIKQVIHTIEFVLGCVSNTASYLRLWALSLAHAELSEVFWNFAMMKTLYMDTGYGFMAFVGWGAWGGATVGVLGVMEALSAFLHALRLHWVEFQNKFYYGDGAQFVPFDIEKLLPSPHESTTEE